MKTWCAANPDTIAGRLKAERLRLGMSQPTFAALADCGRGAQVKWERGAATPNASALKAFAEAGADVLFIVTGRREPIAPASPQALADCTVRQALAMLDPPDRHRLLLDLLATELDR